MGTEKRRPSWWQLWLLLPALGILAFLEASALLSPTDHKVVEIGIVLVVYGLVSVWLRANEAAWLREMQDHVTWHKVGIPLARPHDPAAIPGNNGNGHRTSEWYVPTHPPEPDLLPGDRESEGYDA
jgi:hypothetical protein